MSSLDSPLQQDIPGYPPKQPDTVLALEDEDLTKIHELGTSATTEAALRAALDALPCDQRDAVLARIVDERDYGEIATQLSCSEMVIRKRVSRGLKTLRSEFKEAP
ncbi:MAG TPA: sigma-70 region 4 domain-containing protein [Solirubrobacteraceae bacterium]